METIELPIKKYSEISAIVDKIETGLQAFEQRKSELTELQQKAHGLKITSIDDAASIKIVSTIRKELKAARVGIEKEGKSMRDPLTQISKNIKAKEDELVAIIEPTEKELAVQEKLVADENSRIEKEKDDAEKARIQARIDTLAAFGFSIDYTTIMSIDDATFAGVVKNAEAEFRKEQEAKSEAERLAKLEQERLIAERKELEELRAQQAAAQKIIDDNNARVAKEQADKEAAIQAEKNKLEAEKLAAKKEAEEKEAERLRWIEIDRLKAEAVEAAKLKAIADAKAAAEKLEREQAATKAEEAREAALQPDKVKLQLFSDSLSTLALPVVANENAQVIVNDIQLMINKMQAHIIKKIKDL